MKNFKKAVAFILMIAMVMATSVNVFAIDVDDSASTTDSSGFITRVDSNGVSHVSPATNDEPDTGGTRTFDGDWAISWVNKTLYDDASFSTTYVGIYLPAGVGFTIIGSTDTAYQIDTYVDQYFHAQGLWIEKGSITLNPDAQAGTATSSTTIYGGTSSTYFEAVGSVSSGATVSILSKSDNYYYVEFNDGYYLRKRGWVSASYVTKWGTSAIPTFSGIAGLTTYYSDGKPVFYAPGSGYPSYDTIYYGRAYTLLDIVSIHGVDYAMINYFPYDGATQVRAGYIIWP